MERFTLFDIQREIAVSSRGNALIREMVLFFTYVLIYYFPEYFSINFNLSLDHFALFGSLLIMIAVFDITTSYFRGFRNKKKQIEVLKTRIDAIETIIKNQNKQKLFNSAETFFSLEQRSNEFKEIIRKLQ